MMNPARKLLGGAAAVTLAATAGIAFAATPSSAAGTNAPTNHAYTATTFYIAMTTTQRKVIAVNVPAGAYTVTVRLNPFNSTGLDQFVQRARAGRLAGGRRVRNRLGNRRLVRQPKPRQSTSVPDPSGPGRRECSVPRPMPRGSELRPPW